MSETLSKVLVFTILRHAEDFPWRYRQLAHELHVSGNVPRL